MNQSQFPVNILKYIEFLHEGQVIKNYKAMCKLFNEEIKSSDSKKAQEKEWMRYFDFEKDKQKYIITEIYDTPLPKDDARNKGSNCTYLNHIELLLLNYLYKQNDNQASLTIRSILLLLGMINNNYLNNSWQCKDERITEFQIDHFYQRSYKKLNRVLFDALNNLKNRRLIDYVEDKIIKIDENGQTIYRIATVREKDIIREVERTVLLKLGLESMVQVHLKFKNKIFYSEVNNILYDNYKIHFYYKQINLRFTHEHIYDALNETIEKIQNERKILNTKLINYMNEQIGKNIIKTEEKYIEAVNVLMDKCIGEPNPFEKRKIFRIEDEELYRYAQSQLAEYLLKIN